MKSLILLCLHTLFYVTSYTFHLMYRVCTISDCVVLKLYVHITVVSLLLSYPVDLICMCMHLLCD